MSGSPGRHRVTVTNGTPKWAKDIESTVNSPLGDAPKWARDLETSINSTLVRVTKDVDALLDGEPLSVLGRSSNTAGDVASIAAGTDHQVLRRSGTSLGFGTVNFAGLQQAAGLSVLGVAGNAIASPATISAAVDGNVLRRNGTVLGFGAISLNSSDAVTGTLGLANGGTGATTRTAARTSLGFGSGHVLQSVSASYSTLATLTAVIPPDDTIPQITEGTQILSASIGPSGGTSTIRVRFRGMFASNTGGGAMSAALFNTSSTNAISAALFSSAAANYLHSIVIEVDHPLGGAATLQTYTVRAGPQSGVTMYINGNASRFLGGVVAATLVLEEIIP